MLTLWMKHQPLRRKICLLLSLFPLALYSQAQDPCNLSSWHLVDSITLDQAYQKLTVDTQGNIYVLSSEKRIARKFLRTYDFDSTLQIGGSVTREADNLLHPIDIQVNNYQQLYLLDEGRRTLLIFGKDFELLGSKDFTRYTLEDLSENPSVSLIPQAFQMNSLGELFFLNQWDNKFYQFSPEGNFLQAFGGNDYGMGSLYEPTLFYIPPKNHIFVWEETQKSLLIYDAFGTYLNTFPIPTLSRPAEIKGRDQKVVLLGDQTLYWVQYTPLPNLLCTLSPPHKVVDFAISQQYIYLLGDRDIWIYDLE